MIECEYGAIGCVVVEIHGNKERTILREISNTYNMYILLYIKII